MLSFILSSQGPAPTDAPPEEKSTRSSRTDEDLMQMYQKGDYPAFEELYRRHSGKIYGFLRTRLQNRSEVDDLFQAVFTKLHKSRARYRQGFRFLPWLFVICRSELVDYFRKTQRNREIVNTEYAERVAETGSQDTGNPDPPSPDSGLSGAMDRLPERQHKAVQMRYLEDREFGEIAKALNTSIPNARQLVSRAVNSLRLSLGGKK